MSEWWDIIQNLFSKKLFQNKLGDHQQIKMNWFMTHTVGLKADFTVTEYRQMNLSNMQWIQTGVH